MLDVTAVRHLHDYVLWVQFDDGTEGEVDLRADLWGEVFEPLRDVDVFRQVRINADTGTIEWPNGTDVAPEHLRGLLRTSRV
jgi:hypothetical protein